MATDILCVYIWTLPKRPVYAADVVMLWMQTLRTALCSSILIAFTLYTAGGRVWL